MNLSLNALIYTLFIDPLLSGLREAAYEKVHDSESVIDIAVTSMAVHQFKEDLAINILREIKRISGKVIIADYNCPMPSGLLKSFAYGIESIAKGDYHRNFMNYMSRGGISWFAGSAGLTIQSSEIRGNGVFTVAVCK
jgi:hypothetical protein